MTFDRRKWRQEARTALRLGAHLGRSAISSTLRPDAVSAVSAKAVLECGKWLEDYLGQPHPQLGRTGEICPYIKSAIRKSHVSYRCYDEVTELSVERMAEILLFEGVALERALDPKDPDSDFTAVCVLFPRLRGEDFANAAGAHARIKGALMSRGTMLAVFFPGFEKQGIYNPEFKLYQSPFPIAALRPMAVRDLPFVEFNREAFEEYRRRFGGEFVAGKVSNKYGHVDKFNEAEKRFVV